MKKFVEQLVAVKSAAAFVFSGQIVVLAFVCMFAGYDSVPNSFIWQALVISVVTALLQFVCFSEVVIKKMRYTVRVLLFALPLLLILSGLAYAFHWFPANNPLSWLLFIVVFAVVLALFTASFEIYYRVTGKKYTDQLENYQANHME